MKCENYFMTILTLNKLKKFRQKLFFLNLKIAVAVCKKHLIKSKCS